MYKLIIELLTDIYIDRGSLTFPIKLHNPIHYYNNIALSNLAITGYLNGLIWQRLKCSHWLS